MHKFDWKYLKKLGKKEHLKRWDFKPIGFDFDVPPLKKCIIFSVFDRHFGDYGEFSHSFGVPGIWFSGWLPWDSFEGYTSYVMPLNPDDDKPHGKVFTHFDEIPVKTEEEFYRILGMLRRVRYDRKTEMLVYKEK